MRRLFLAVSGMFAAVPGFAIMWKGIGTPPDYGFMFGGVIEAFGSLTLILLWMNRAKIKAGKPKTIIVTTIVLGIASFISLTTYLVLYSFCIISHPQHHIVFFPLWSSGDLSILITEAGGRYKALDQFGYSSVYGAVQDMPFYAIPVTAAVLLFFYQAIFTPLAAAFSLVGFHKGEKLEIESPPNNKPKG